MSEIPTVPASNQYVAATYAQHGSREGRQGGSEAHGDGSHVPPRAHSHQQVIPSGPHDAQKSAVLPGSQPAQVPLDQYFSKQQMNNPHQPTMIYPGAPYTFLTPIYPRIPLPQEVMEDEPLYVNPRQYHRIIKRRQQRAKQEADFKARRGNRKVKYLHESRHLHAMRRQRGLGGKFVKKDSASSKEKSKSDQKKK